MEVEFVKISPTQNMTILVTSEMDRKYYKDAATKIMAYDNVYAEQVGFVEKPSDPKAVARLQMAGGEFCGNAILAMCAYLVWNGKVKCEDECVVPLEASGVNGILNCNVKKQNGYFICKAHVPVPQSIKTFNAEIMGTEYALPVVYMSGISHVIVDTESVNLNKEDVVDALIPKLASFTKEDAVGFMFLNKAECSIEPFVYVITSDTKVWERGCGSGTASVGAYLAYDSKKSVKADVAQPGGIITVEANVADGEITTLSIEGKTVIAAQGRAFI